MPAVTRKEFLQTAALLAASTLAGPAFALPKKNVLLSFSTLGCPDWTLPQITGFAVQHGYKAIELRGLQRQLDLTLCPELSTAAARQKTTALMRQNGLRFAGLGSSANLHQPEGAEREKNLAEARRFIDLAQQIACPYVRVFPNNLPKDVDKNTAIERMVNGLQQLGDYAKNKNVVVLMETHGDVVRIDDLETIMQKTAHAHVGLIWDVANMWNVTKEPPADVYKRLQKYIRHTHLKDAKRLDGGLQYTLLGQGDVPVFEAINALAKDNYKGYYSFEWEKLWHPEIAEPELAFAHYAKRMQEHFKSR